MWHAAPFKIAYASAEPSTRAAWRADIVISAGMRDGVITGVLRIEADSATPRPFAGSLSLR